MQTSNIQQSISSIEECADEAKRAAASAPGDLKQSVEQLHQQARQAQQACSSNASQQQGDASQLREPVMQLEQAADRAMQACRNAGNVDPQLQQAIQRAHQQASSLKKQLQMG
ncbi:hypothetical protein [Ramlibacter alkalitolerans]|uniref:Uncharacterized protein n=1 Tax=Ramlibacter alkalitolerans TaxID=2039631 RepID=A0ABS1JIN8_9BURK|nr:hypothetical protein [Ramlibacter alkalitolerans]MBL0424085.1 hypothetical protein [Ramlibacter alkalitolerans]